MPSRPSSRGPDLERVLRILDGARPPERRAGPPPTPAPAGWSEPGRWVPGPPGREAPAGRFRADDARLGDGRLGDGQGDARLGDGRRDDGRGEGLGDDRPGDELERLDTDLRRARRPALLTVPEALRRGRASVTSGAVVALLALVVALGCAFALRVLWAERAAEGGGPVVTPGPAGSSAPRVVVSSAPVTGAPPREAPATSAGATRAATSEVVVHVVGQVRRPGLVRLRSGSRVADALAAAGGAGPGADLTAVNLARPVVDGEQVHVPRPGETPPPPPGTGGSGASGGSAAGGSSGSGSAGGVPIDLNTADAAALDTLPGVGPVLAQRILDWRAEHGRFTAVDELGEVSGIGDKLLAQLRDRVRV